MSETYHVETIETVETPETFAFTAENRKRAEAVIAKYPAGRQRSAVMPLLDLAQRQAGWLSRDAMDCVAGMLGMPPIKVYEVATFYTMYNLKPVGRLHVQICTNISCWLRGAPEIVRAAKDVLGVAFGETTADGAATLSEVECLGACANAPVMQVNDDLYEDLTYDTAKAVLEALLKGEAPPFGSQTGRRGSCPCKGATTLKELAGEHAAAESAPAPKAKTAKSAKAGKETS
ncbi:NADH-quinone oxidoreductase subunit NuoE [Oleispirillum naphthae]|uniref:NADH-quinone oxidoreductase subunit NuoE n=1 Tax=Oleispirillum naphthae TaxID=2838853 RepID=UPI0030822847